MRALLREVRYREAMDELLTRQYEVARVDEARQGSLVQVVDPAIVPDRPSLLTDLDSDRRTGSCVSAGAC